MALIWAWMLLFVFLPNLLVIVASFLVRDDVHFVRPEASLESYARLLDPVYAGVFLDSLGMAVTTTLLGLGIVDAPLRMLYTEGAVIAGLVYVLLPFMILPLYAVFEQLREDLLEVSSDLGAARWRTFRYVVLPLTMPGVLAGCLLVLIPAVGMFYVADVLGGARHLLIGNVIKNQFLDARDWPFGAAASILLTLAMALLLYAYYLSARMVRRRSADDALA